MSKEDIVEAGIKFVKACMLVAQVEAKLSTPRSSARINSILSSDWHHAMSEMSAALVELYDAVAAYRRDTEERNP